MSVEMHPSHRVVRLPRDGGRVYVACDRPDCGADAIIDGDKPCPVPVRSPLMEFWEAQDRLANQESAEPGGSG